MAFEEKVEELRRCVETAFADAVYPGDSNIATNPGCCDECRYTDDFFRGRHWRELTSEQKLPTGWGGLSLLTAAAWRFYLPAYLLLGLSQSEYAHDTAETVMFQLGPRDTADLEGFFQERSSGFSDAQQECLAAYTRYFSERDPEDEDYQATADYWQGRMAAIEPDAVA